MLKTRVFEVNYEEKVKDMTDINSDISYLKPVQLTPGVHRITANNSGPMTGPGTNCYIVGTQKIAVIDPGPLIDEHVQCILDNFGERIKWVVVTHTHRDHSPAAAELVAQTGAKMVGNEIPNDGFQDPTFENATPLLNDDTIETDTRVIRAILTPGHVSNHVCFLIEEDGLLMTGDHMMEGSTVVIVPPAGSMKKYIHSLERLLAYEFKYVAPGHGTVIVEPKREIERLIAHRLGRESKVIDKLGTSGSSTISKLTPLVYDDVDPSLHEWASLSLHAHLIKLQEEKFVLERNGHWQLQQKENI